MKLAVLGSTRGTNLQPVHDAILQGALDATIEVVLSNKPDTGILAKARELGLPAHFLDSTGLSRESYDDRVSAILISRQVDLVVLVGYMRILSASFVQTWHHQIINVHPSLLPAFAGLMDMAVHESVLAAGVPETGCTVHYVTEEVDAGPVILQKACAVLPGDTPDMIKERVQQLEGVALVEAISRIKGSNLT